MKKLEMKEMEVIEGGVSRAQYCGTLWSTLTGGGYQGDVLWGWQVYGNNCAGHFDAKLKVFRFKSGHFSYMRYLFFLLLLLTGENQLQGQDRSYIRISGTVTNSKDNSAIVSANVYLRRSSIGTFTNETGQFTFFVPDSLANDTLVVSSIGYKTFFGNILDLKPKDDLKIVLELSEIILEEVIIQAKSDYAGFLVEQALKNLPYNLSKKQFLLQAFYRELAIIDSTYIRLIEAAIEIQDYGYGSDLARRKIEVIELRKSEDNITYGVGSTLVKLLFGEDNMLYKTVNLDFLRRQKTNPKLEVIDQKSFLDEYNFHLEGYTSLDNDSLAIVGFHTDESNTSRPYYEGKLFIKLKDKAVIKMEYGMLANPKMTFRNQNDVYYQGKFFFKASIDYKLLDEKYFLSRLTFIKPVNFDAVKNGKGQQYAVFDLSVNNVITRKKDFDRIRKRDSQENDVDLYGQDFKYNQDFWQFYNMVKLNPLLKKVKTDLEKEESLEHQFKKNEH